MINLVKSVFLYSMPSVFAEPPGINIEGDAARIMCLLTSGGVEPTIKNAFSPPPKVPVPYTHIKGVGPAYHVRTSSYSHKETLPTSGK